MLMKNNLSFRTALVDGFKIFYREAGDPLKPAVLLLHGFPTSSHMFRNLIPHLAQDYHVIAPDLPGFGFSDAPNHEAFRYTFENVAKVMGDFVEQIGEKNLVANVRDALKRAGEIDADLSDSARKRLPTLNTHN